MSTSKFIFFNFFLIDMILILLHRLDLTDIEGIIFDTTSTNTGKKGGLSGMIFFFFKLKFNFY